MALNITQGQKGTGQNSDSIIRDVDDKVWFLNAETSPLISMLKKTKKNSKSCTSQKFEHYEKDQGTPILTVSGAIADGSTTNISLAAGEGTSVMKDDTIYVPSTGEQLIVTAVNIDTITVVRGYGEISGAAIADGANLVLLGNSAMQGTGAPEGKSLNSSNVYNYVEIQKDAVDITASEAGTNRYDEKNPKLVEKRGEVMTLHQEALERKFMFGQRKEDTSGKHVKYTTRGFINFIQTNVHDMGGTFSRTKVNQFLRDVFLYGKGDKIMFLGSELLDAFDADIFTNASVNLTPASSSYGLDVVTWVSPYGSIKLAYHRVLSQIHPDWGLCIDLQKTKYRYLTGRNTHIKQNVQANDEDSFKDLIITEAGLQLMNEKNHGILKLG